MAIRTRLNLWYIGVLAMALLFSSGLLYSVLTTVLTSVQDDRLANQARSVVTAILAENDPASVLESGRVRLPAIDVFGSQYFVEIVDLDGQPVQLSDSMQGRQVQLPADVRSEILAGRALPFTLDVGGGSRLRIYSMPILVDQNPIGAVEMGLSLRGTDESLGAIRSTMALAALLGLLLAAAGGVILGRAATRPIQVISATARQITLAEDLSRRIPIAVPNDELGQLTATINAMLARLESLFAAQQRLVADVSHELRTPLTTIRGNLDLLHRGAVDDAVMRGEALRAIEDETDRMSRLVNDLLLLARADAGLKLRRELVELDTLLLEVYRQAHTWADSQGVSIKLGAEDQALVLGDADRLRQLLLNLVDNAVKYSPPGGQVTLTLQKSGEWVHVAVSDTGPGIAAADLPHIFDRFYRADRSRGRPGGAGLGLAIASWVAAAHGGRLSAESMVGQGSVFRLWLPLASTPATVAGPIAEPMLEEVVTE